MSRHDAHAGESGVTRTVRGPRRGVTGLAVIALVTLGSGLAACGDDDDAAGTTELPSSSTTAGASATTDADTTLPPEITQSDGSTVSSDATTGGSDTSAASDGTDSATTDAASDAALAAETSSPDGSAPSGPTTTGPECEFAENSEYPLVRCNMGPAVAVLQSVLQADGYEVSTVDGMFGDETLYAVQAFQEAEGLTVDGIVGVETWTALNPQGVGNDDNGNGVTDPDEVELADEA